MQNKFYVETLVIGALSTNCYLVYDNISKEAIIIDPADDADFISSIISRLHLKPLQIIATHGHFDHILAGFELQTAYHIPFSLSKKDEFLICRVKSTAHYFLQQKIDFFKPHIDIDLDNNDAIVMPYLKFKIMFTPGHTPGSICLYNEEIHWLFSGDTIFANGAVGRTDFEYSDYSMLNKSIAGLLKLPDKTIIYTGHGDATTLEKERKYHE